MKKTNLKKNFFFDPSSLKLMEALRKRIQTLTEVVAYLQDLKLHHVVIRLAVLEAKSYELKKTTSYFQNSFCVHCNRLQNCSNVLNCKEIKHESEA